MCNQDFFNYLLDLCILPQVKLTRHDICNDDLIYAMEKMGIFQKKTFDSCVPCPECGEFWPLQFLKNCNDEKKMLIHCSDCGLQILNEQQLYYWSTDYRPIIQSIKQQLMCVGNLVELLTDTLWSLGRIGIAGQSREFFIARNMLDSNIKNQIKELVPSHKTTVLLVLGGREMKIDNLESKQIFSIRDTCAFDDEGVHIDKSLLEISIRTNVQNPKSGNKKVARNSQIGALIIRLKTELRQYMLGVYSAMEQADRLDKHFEFKPLKQVELAQVVGVDKYTISRALKKDLELKALFDAANSSRSTYAYGRKAIY